MKKILKPIAFTSISLLSIGVKAEVTQADVNLDFGRFAGFWVYEGCEKKDTNEKCWFIIEKKKELYGEKEYFTYANQKAIPAKTEVLKNVCADFKYTTGFTVSNLPNKAICVKVIDAGEKAELYYPVGYTGHGTYKIVKSSEAEFMRRVDENSDSLRKRANR